MPPPSSTHAGTRWITRILPFILAAIVGLVTYTFVAKLCDGYLLKVKRQTGLVIALLCLYFIFFLLVLATYIRMWVVVTFDPGLVPLGPEAISRREQNKAQPQSSSTQNPEGAPAVTQGVPYAAAGTAVAAAPGSQTIDFEPWYSKDVFVCESDGRPRWCHDCMAPKSDRVHHASEMDRCVYKMDHFCPWVGGMVAGNSFKFFFQFNFYTTLYCALVLGATIYGLQMQSSDPINPGIDPLFIANIGLSGFFAVFTTTMSITNIRFILTNLSSVDVLSYGMKVYQLAVRVDRNTQPDNSYGVVVYPVQPGHAIASSGPVPGTTLQNGDVPQSSAAVANLPTRTFAILRTEPGENPWDLGWRRNWRSVMGTNVFDWLLPVHRSPCVDGEGSQSFYPMGKVLTDLRKRHGLKPASDETDGTDEIQLRNVGPRRNGSASEA